MSLSRRNFLKSTVAFAAATGLSLPVYDAGLVKDWGWYNGTGRDVGPLLQYLVDNFDTVNVPSDMSFVCRSVVEITRSLTINGGFSPFESHAEHFLKCELEEDQSITVKNFHIINKYKVLPPLDYSTMGDGVEFYSAHLDDAPAKPVSGWHSSYEYQIGNFIAAGKKP